MLLGVLVVVVATPPRAPSSLQPDARPVQGLGGDDDWLDDNGLGSLLGLPSSHAASDAEQCGAECGDDFQSIIKYAWYASDEDYDSPGKSDVYHKSGLSDDLQKISFHLGVARSLCARLYFPKPWQMLDVQLHNHGRPLERTWGWERYFSFPTKYSELLVGPGDEHKVGGSHALETNTYRDEGSTLAETYANATRIGKEGGAFTWTMKGPIYLASTTVYNQLGPSVPPECKPLKLPSPLVERTAASVLGTLGLSADSEFSVLQVRRGDTTSMCNTTTSAVVSYMRCAVGDKETGDRLLLMTDETDATYLNTLLTTLRSEPRWAGGVTHLDAAIIEELDSADRSDNFLVYAVAMRIKSLGSSEFRMHPPSATLQGCDGECGGMKFHLLSEAQRARRRMSFAAWRAR